MSLLSVNRLAAAPVRQRGVSLVELMVGMVIGLLAVIVISRVLLVSEGQKRTTSGGADAQVNGALALYSLQRDVQMAGYGLVSSPGVVGCPINARFNGAMPTGFPTTLAPVVITRQADRPAGSIGDAIRVLASSKSSYSLPTQVIDPGFPVAGVAFPVTAALGVQAGDLALAATDAVAPCWVFQVSAAPTSQTVPRADDAAKWNPTSTVAYAYKSLLINLGTLVDNSYQIVDNKLQLQSFDLTNPSVRVPRDIQPDIVNMKALYGKDTSVPPDGAVDRYDDVTPTTNAGWLQVLTIRLAIVARSGQFEKEDVTTASPLWDVGTTPPATGAAACGASECLTLSVNHLTDWRRYRYKTFDTVIPLRNMLWKS